MPTEDVREVRFSRIGVRWRAYDLGGRLEARSFWPSYLGSVDAIVWVADCSDARLEESRAWFWRVLEHVQGRRVPVLVIANQGRTRGGAEEPMSSEMLARLLGTESAKGSGIPVHVMESNALEGTAVDVGLHWIQTQS